MHPDIAEALRATTFIARGLGITKAAPYQWRKAGKVPADRARPLAALIKQPLYKIRPDLFPRRGGL